MRYPLLTIEEWSAEIKRLATEFEALDHSLEVAKAQVAELVDRNDASPPQPAPSSEALTQFIAAVDSQRQHTAALWRLLTDALQRNFRSLQPRPPAMARELALITRTSEAPNVWP